jgi:choline dehydrogenase
MNEEPQAWDYVVAGGGQAGCVLAARLSERPDVRVLLVEAGPAGRLPAMSTPAAWPGFIGSEADWGDVVLEPETGRPVAWTRGFGLGGSANINGMVFLRGHRSGYDDWLPLGAKGWGYDDLLPFFKRSELTNGRDPAVRGTVGNIAVGPSSAAASPVVGALLDAVLAVGHKASSDPTAGLDEGFGWHDLAIADGKRSSAVDSYLTPVLTRPNLAIVTDALVHRVLVDGHRCTGIEYSRNGQLVRAECLRDVVLTAGTVGSAQILLQSGIGPSDHLRDVGIEVALDLPGVGANLQDHVMSTVVYSPSRELPPCTAGTGEASGLLHFDSGEGPADIQILLAGFPFFVPSLPGPETGYTISASLMAPRSRGTVRLSNATPGAKPVLEPRYFSAARDMAVMIAGLRMAREIGASDAVAAWRGEEVLPGPGTTTDSELRAYVRDSFISYFHPVGTCRIGTDEAAVVDPELRVRGIEGLRVADASVMPLTVSANTMAAVYGIAERAASLIGG